MATWTWILILIAALVIVGLIVIAAKNRRTAALRQRFGDEYDRTVQARKDRRAAEAELLGRQKKRAQLDIRPLPEAERARYAQDWHEVQERFVDEPANAVVTADSLVGQVMRARGYPMDNFASQSDLLSVDYPKLVENYRFAHGVYERSQTQQASTEDLREAMLRYRSLFDELLGANGADTARAPAGTTATRAGTTGASAGTTGAPAGTAGAPAGGTDTPVGTAGATADAPEVPAEAAGTRDGTKPAPAERPAATTSDNSAEAPADTTASRPEDGRQGTTDEHYDTTRRGTR
ncbi:MAG TPA: hypothetical protein VIV12_02205 [Streptosporangiaceae bacterium]